MTFQLSTQRIDTSRVVFPQILRVRDYIDEKRGERPLAARRDILPEEIGFALGRITIMDVSHDPLDFVYRLYGSEISQSDHDEVTRKSVYDIEPGPYRDQLVACYCAAVEAREAIYHEMAITDGRRTARYQRGLFPLSDDGIAVNMLLSVTWWTSALDPLWNDYLAQQ